MKLENYIDKTVNLYKAAYIKLERWHKEKQSALDDFRLEAARLTREAANEKHIEIVKKYEEKLSSILEELQSGVSAVESEYMKEVKAFYTPNGAAVNAADQALIASGILTNEEICDMVLRYTDNPTMERIIHKYVLSLGVQNLPTDVLRVMTRAASGGENEQRIFKKMKDLLNAPVGMAKQGFAGTESYVKACMKADDYAQEIKEDLRKAQLAPES